MTSKRIARFDFAERANHWMSAILFLYLALTGLALWSRKLYWLAAVFGGGSVVRAIHPIAGALFALSLTFMFVRWRSQMSLDADDREWLRQSSKYATNQEEGLPESGKFNGGQKMMFWMQWSFGIVLLASGVVLWFPEVMPRTLRLAAVLIHPLAAVGAIGGIILHIYMGTAAVPGALRSMIRGWVTARWAAAHHPKWHRQINNS
ncbi:MAG: formate dehydrogenase subunit gamma [Bryobacteraceae bacterium]